MSDMETAEKATAPLEKSFWNRFKRERFSPAQRESLSLSAEEISKGHTNPWVAKLLENYFAVGCNAGHISRFWSSESTSGTLVLRLQEQARTVTASRELAEAPQCVAAIVRRHRHRRPDDRR